MLGIGSDHGGFVLKEAVKAHLEARGIEVKDFGTYSPASCDYPDYGRAVALAVAFLSAGLLAKHEKKRRGIFFGVQRRFSLAGGGEAGERERGGKLRDGLCYAEKWREEMDDQERKMDGKVIFFVLEGYEYFWFCFLFF